MLQLLHIDSLAQLRAAAPAWDDLWRRSEATVPTARAELVAQWKEHFAPNAPFHALAVHEGGTWLAVLPLVETRLLRTLRVGMLPANSWAPGGALLLDKDRPADPILDTLVAHLRTLPWRVLLLDQINPDLQSSKSLQAALGQTRMSFSLLERYQVARLEIDHDWEAYAQRWSKSFRKETSRLTRRLSDQGEVAFEACCAFGPDQVEEWVRCGFDVEDRSWKGRAGTSVMRCGMVPFFLRQACQLAEWGQLELTFLRSAGRPIAFAYGATAKGVHHSFKIGYDDAYADYNPGHLLHHEMLRRFWHDPAYRAVDFVAEVTAAQRHWKPDTYRLARLAIGVDRVVGRTMVYAHEHWWPRLRILRQRIADRRARDRKQQGMQREAGRSSERQEKTSAAG